MSKAWLLLQKFACWEAVVVLGGLCLVVGVQMLRRNVNLHGVFLTKDGCGESSPARVQVLLFTVAFALYYLIEVIGKPTKFPPVPHEVLYALAGSHSFYLAAKSDLLGMLSSKS